MNDVHSKPIEARIDWLSALAARHGEDYRSPEAMLARARYQSQHPTAIAVLKCMDGRINIPVATGTPIGLLMPFRNLGGRFDLGWPHLGEVVTQYVMDRVHEGRQVLFLVTYHYSRGDHHRGCAGFDYDQQAAINHTQEIKQQISTILALHMARFIPWSVVLKRTKMPWSCTAPMVRYFGLQILMTAIQRR